MNTREYLDIVAGVKSPPRFGSRLPARSVLNGALWAPAPALNACHWHAAPPTEMQPPAGCQGCAEEGACGAAHPGASLPMADLNYVCFNGIWSWADSNFSGMAYDIIILQLKCIAADKNLRRSDKTVRTRNEAVRLDRSFGEPMI